MILKKEDKKISKDSLAGQIVKLYDNHPLNGEEHLNRAYYLAFYNGHQYVKISNDQIQDMTDEDDGGIRQRSKINVIKPYAHITISKLVKDLPIISGIPTGNSEKDKLAARAATKLLRHAFDQNQRNLISDLYAVLLDAYIFGTSYWHIFWNPNLYRKIRTIDPKTKKESVKEALKGDWDLKVCDDFEVYPDASAKEFKEIRYLIHADYIDVDEAKKLYSVKKDTIKEITSNEIEEKRYAYGHQDYTNQDLCKKNLCFRLQYWEKPSDDYEEGRHIVVLNKTILAHDDINPNAKYGDLFSIPYIPFFWDKNAMRFHGNSALADAIPIQKEINALASIVMLNARTMASVSLAFPKGWGVKKSEFMGNMCNVYEYNAAFGAAPVTLGGQALPGFVSGHLSMLMGSMQDAMGIHEVSQAQLPERGSHLPASALKMLMDSEMVRHAPSMRLMQSSLRLAGNLILKLIKENYKEERYLTIMGDGYKYETQAFIASDLDGSFDITLQVTSGVNSSPSAKFEAFLNLWDRQIPQAAAQGDKAAQSVLAGLEFGDTETAMRKEQLFQARTEWWFDQLTKKRKAPMIYDGVDNIDMMLEKLIEHIISEEFQDEDESYKKAILSARDALLQLQQKQPKPGAEGQPPGAPPAGGEPPPAPNAMEQSAAMGAGGEGGVEVPNIPAQTVQTNGQ
jgi:hypothetical protein